MSRYFTHTCGELRASDAGRVVTIAGWVNRVRDLGALRFIALRDHYGITQVTVRQESPAFAIAERAKLESVVTVTGKVVLRADNANANLPTGEIELDVT